MPIKWSVEFHCDVCNANITYEDEAPNIYTDRQSVIENNKALRWLQEHRNDPPTVAHPKRVIHYDEWPIINKGWQAVISQTKYILCNVCGARIYIG